MSDQDNHDTGSAGKAIDTVILRYDRMRDKLEIGGHAESLDLMLDILHRATRTLETQYRQQAALELQQKIQNEQRNAALAASVFGKR